MITYLDKLGLIYIQDGKILMARNINIKNWYIPGGQRLGDETDEQALIRELEEELSVTVLPKTMHLFGVFEAHADQQPEDVYVRIRAYLAEFEGALEIDHEIEEYGWLSYEDKESTSEVGVLIFDALREKGLL